MNAADPGVLNVERAESLMLWPFWKVLGEITLTWRARQEYGRWLWLWLRCLCFSDGNACNLYVTSYLYSIWYLDPKPAKSCGLFYSRP